MIYEATDPAGGLLLDLVNARDAPCDCVAASLTAPGLVRCVVTLDGTPHDVVFAGAGGSHTWWTQGGNKLLPNEGLKPGQRLTIAVDGPAALRIDWLA